MQLKINGKEIAAYPSNFSVTPLDLDDGDATVRTADGTLNRDRVAVKRQIDMTFGVLTWAEISSVLKAMSGVFFDFYYPDPMTGKYETKSMYVGNRPSPAAVSKNGQILWNGLKVTLTER
ncbi:DUF6711 family protein [Paenibacillus sp. URB8-2]|uniref:DUF6711 family protein n=1 Tax=Paenibacillus sp. URB8-2 TaxID=2741301 RepID=UPI0015BEBB7A|nr:DUF6711 family protein [Paenibacillus sp. URB8-2]BCG57490.1 hypothetical protein PUR_09150 [Paenibacillus sp. URB8-2]